MINQTDNNFLDISKLFSGEVREIAFDRGPFPFPQGDEEIAVSNLCFSGTTQELSGFYRLIGKVSGEFCAACGRCLAPVREEFAIEIDFPIVTTLSESEEEAVVAEGQKIDLKSIAEEAVYLNLPLRLLCCEDCKGLCPKCGINLNTNSCECDQKEIDPRLAGLADFFKEK